MWDFLYSSTLIILGALRTLIILSIRRIKVHIWIDATNPRSELRIFEMTLLEQQLHTLREAGLEPVEIDVQLASETTNLPSLRPAPLVRKRPIQRNINVPFFIVGLLLGFPVAAFVVIAVWQVVSLDLHTLHQVQCWNSKEREQEAG